MSSNNKKVYLVDGSGYIFRAYYAVPPLRTKEGFPTNALYGYLRMILKLLSASDSEHVVVVFDAGRETFRNEMYAEYKANRSECPEDLLKQIPYFKELSTALGLKILEKQGFEADDILGTLTRKLTESDIEVVIVSGDKDLMQLVGKGVTIWDTMRDIRYDEKGVKDKMGVNPKQVIELLAIMGDSSDNVPGLKGAGPKTALQLIEKYGDVENIIKSSNKIAEDIQIRNRKKISQQIESDADLIRLSKELVKIRTDVDLPIEIISGQVRSINGVSSDELYSALLRCGPSQDLLQELVEKFEFASVVSDFNLNISSGGKEKEIYDYRTIYADEFFAWIEELKRQKLFSFDLETSSLDTLSAEIIGASFCWSDDIAYYLPFKHKSSAKEQISLEQFFDGIRGVFNDKNILKAGQNLKYDLGVLANYSIKVEGLHFDTMVAAYLLNPDRRSYNLSALAADILGRRLIEFEELLGENSSYAEVQIDEASLYACQDAHVAWLVMKELRQRIEREELQKLFYDIEMPLVAVLQKMERAGVKIEVDMLAKLSAEFKQELSELQEQLYSLAGCEFNLNSPKQLADVLFNKLSIGTKGLKKTKTGISTDSSVLEKLALQHPLPKLLLRYRTLHKLKSTYVDVLPTMISLKTGRLHAKFNQTQTGTGRLSSSDPNLQNIPIQTEEGRKIRQAFIAEPEYSLLSADYSQIELRILAHLSVDENLISAFKNDLDIHAKTAREIMGLSENEEINAAVRRIGKTINFGVIYGMSGFRLARELEIPVSVANQYIDNYFNNYPKVKEFFAALQEEAETNGFVKTLFGRKRLIGDIDTSGRDKGFALRAAINAPMQGTAADLIKLAMVDIDRKITSGNMPLRMIMQIHDELVFECRDDFCEEAQRIIIESMENVYRLQVPLKVDCKIGKSWQEAHL